MDKSLLSLLCQGREYDPGWSCMAEEGGGGGGGGESAGRRQGGDGGGGGGGSAGSEIFARCQEWGRIRGTLRLISKQSSEKVS